MGETINFDVSDLKANVLPMSTTITEHAVKSINKIQSKGIKDHVGKIKELYNNGKIKAKTEQEAINTEKN